MRMEIHCATTQFPKAKNRLTLCRSCYVISVDKFSICDFSNGPWLGLLEDNLRNWSKLIRKATIIRCKQNQSIEILRQLKWLMFEFTQIKNEI